MTLDETELVVDEGDGGFTPFMLIYDEAGPEDARYLIAANLRRGYEEDSATLTKEGETPERLMWPLRMGLGSEPGPVLRNPSLPCYDDGSTAFGMIGAISAAAFEADSHTGSLSVTINAQDRKCDGTRRNPKSYVNVSGTLTLIPIFIEHPRDVEGGANRTAESQFVYDDSDPGALEIEYRLSTPEAGLTSFLEENIRWSAHRVDDCFMNIDDWEVDYIWPNQDDKWYPVTDPEDRYGKGTSATVRFERLPSCNEGFGRKIVKIDVLNPDTGERGTSLADLGRGYAYAGRAEYEVFFNRTATNHPGPDRIFAGSSCADMPAGTERQENWLNYWSQTVNVDGALRGSDLDYFWLASTSPGEYIAETLRVHQWECYTGGLYDILLWERSDDGALNPGVPGYGFRGLLGAPVGIHFLAALLIHEYTHVRQLGCYNRCGENAFAPFHNPQPLLAVSTPALGWSFNIHQSDPRWNHFHPDDPLAPEVGGLILDEWYDDMCDHEPNRPFCEGIEECYYMPPNDMSLGALLCPDPHPALQPTDFEFNGIRNEAASHQRDSALVYMRADWACPGQQWRTEPVSNYEPESAADWDFEGVDDCTPNNGDGQ